MAAYVVDPGIQSGRGRLKRPSLPKINWASPSARGLVSAGLCNMQKDLVSFDTQTYQAAVIAGATLGGLCASMTAGAVSLPLRTALDALTAYTLSAWIYPTTFTGNYNAILGKTTANTNQRTFDLDLTDTTGLPRLFYTVGAGNYQGFSGTTAPALNAWSHIAGTFDGTTQRLFLNGRAIGTNTPTGTPDVLTTMPVTYGRLHAADSANNYRGSICQALIHNRALSQNELRGLYDPATRWDLYAVPSRQVWFNIVAAGLSIPVAMSNYRRMRA